MSAFRKRAEMLSLPAMAPINTPTCEPHWHKYDVPSCKRFVSGRKHVRPKTSRTA